MLVAVRSKGHSFEAPPGHSIFVNNIVSIYFSLKLVCICILMASIYKFIIFSYILVIQILGQNTIPYAKSLLFKNFVKIRSEYIFI